MKIHAAHNRQTAWHLFHRNQPRSSLHILDLKQHLRPSLAVRTVFPKQSDRLFHAHNSRSHQRAQSDQSDSLLFAVCTITSGSTSFQDRSHQNYNFPAGLHDIFPDIMDISFDCGKDHFSFLLLFCPLRSTLFSRQCILSSASALIRSCGRKIVPFSNPFQQHPAPGSTVPG